MRIIFRADGNSTIGLGHVIRSLALAEMVGTLFSEQWLAIRAPSAAVRELARQSRVEVATLPLIEGPAEAFWLATHWLRTTDVVVLDGYEFGTVYQQAVHASGCRLVAIDDMAAWPQGADLVINHAPGISPATYVASPTTRFCLGPAFSLVRPPFRHRFRLPAQPEPIKAVVICFGGADPMQLTLRTLLALLQNSGIEQISLIVGSAFEHLPTLAAAVRDQAAGRANLYQNITADEMADLFLAHQVVICSASTVLLESLLLGCPVLTGYFADNQQHLAEYVHQHQQAYSLGNFLSYSDNELANALTQGLGFLQSHARQPYTQQLDIKQLLEEFKRLRDS
jgi:UDP-2,4-diacetamido-2,4,6-trideoxy-beta-L-altropyranose hydrolase